MDNKKLLTLLVGAGITLGCETTQAEPLDDLYDIEIDPKNNNLSLDVYNISELSIDIQGHANGGCGNGSCGNGACGLH